MFEPEQIVICVSKSRAQMWAVCLVENTHNLQPGTSHVEVRPHHMKIKDWVPLAPSFASGVPAWKIGELLAWLLLGLCCQGLACVLSFGDLLDWDPGWPSISADSIALVCCSTTYAVTSLLLTARM